MLNFLPEVLGLQTSQSSELGCSIMEHHSIKGPCGSKLSPLQFSETVQDDTLSQLWPAASSSIPVQATRNATTRNYATSW